MIELAFAAASAKTIRTRSPTSLTIAQALMRRRGEDLLEEITESALFRLGRAISSCLVILTSALEDGVASGAFRAETQSSTVRAVLGSRYWLARWYRPQGRLRARDIAREYADVVLYGVAVRPAPVGRA